MRIIPRPVPSAVVVTWCAIRAAIWPGAAIPATSSAPTRPVPAAIFPAAIQPAAAPPQPDSVTPADSVELLQEARSAQASFERLRVREMRWSASPASGPCDENIGRMCIRHGPADDWEPPPESEATVQGRADLIATLETIGSRIPGDRWILGQRIRYLGEADRWEEAEAVARGCHASAAETWWCDALLGYVLHYRERFPEALEAFEKALQSMDPDRASRWRDPEPLLDRVGSRMIRDRKGADRTAFETLVWTLADPLYLIPGNDYLTEHLARHVSAAIREGAQNPYGLRWGDDLAEITVRYGTGYAWEKDVPRVGASGPPPVTGRFHPRSRGLLPPGEYLDEPATMPAGAWTTDARRGPSRYAPAYSPRIHSLDTQIALFRRGEFLLAVAAWELPDWRETEDSDPAPPPPGPYEAGLFLVPTDRFGAAGASTGNDDGDAAAPGGATSRLYHGVVTGPDAPPGTAETRVVADRRGVLQVTAPAGDYVISVEAWHAEARKAWRARQGVRQQPLRPGVVEVSSLLLLEPGHAESLDDLTNAATYALPRTDVGGRSVGVAWEVYQLEPGTTVGFRLSIRREDRSLLRRAGEWLGLLAERDPLAVAWSEPILGDAGWPLFRAVDFGLESLEPGEYELRLDVSVPGRETASSTRRIRIVPSR